MTDVESEMNKKIQDYRELFVKKKLFRRKHETQENDDEYLDLISFSLLEETYGINLMSLKEILKAENIERVPKCSNYLLGVLNLRGTLITIVDLKKRLGFDTSTITKDSRIIIVEYQKRSIGFLVDRVHEIMKLEKQSIIEPPVGVNTIKQEIIEGIVKTKGGEIILPNLSKILEFH